MRALAATLVSIAILVVACAAPSPPTPRSAPQSLSPDEDAADACDRTLRSDTAAARNIRSSVDLTVTGIPATDAAIARAATDPGADTATLGIPLRATELRALQASGMFVDAATPLAMWVNEGRPDRFGGIWIDPPGSGRYVVSVAFGEPSTQALARCLERPGLDVRYIASDVALADLRDVQDRINEDWQDLEAAGIRIRSTGIDSKAHRVQVEVEGLSQAQAVRLTDRYGPFLDLVATPVPTPDLPLAVEDIPLAIGESGLFGGGDRPGRGETGAWRIAGGRIEGASLVLPVVIEPADVTLPVEAGPAVLFAAMQLYGGSGDVGFTEPIDILVTVGLPRCDPAPGCRFTTDLVLPLDEVEPALRRLEAKTDEILWLEIDATLVRTFAGGTWLQTLSLLGEVREGRLGEPVPVDGPLEANGLFPSRLAQVEPAGEGWFSEAVDWGALVEGQRTAVGDPTRPVPSIPGTFEAELDPRCDHGVGISMHTDAGDTVVDERVLREGQRTVTADLALPVGTTWRVTLHDTGGIDYAGRDGWGVTVGTIRATGEPLDVRVVFDCPAKRGTLTVNGTPSP